MPSSSSVDLNRVDLNLLVAFDALMAERSVTAAAARLSVGQSAMSSTLGRLRALFNDPVLVREGRTMVATPVAESLAGPVRETLDRIQSMLSNRRGFDPAADERTFTVTASDYTAVAVLQPLLAYATAHTPNIGLRIQPMGMTAIEQLVRGQTDLVIIPRAVFPGGGDFCWEPLYTDRYLLAVDAANQEVGDTISIEQFSTLPYLATHFDLHPSLPEPQLDLLGIPRRVEATTGIAAAPFLLRGTRLITFISASLGSRIASAAGIRLLEPPMPLQPLSETMVWARRLDDDPAHRWLRQQLHRIAEEHFGEDGHRAGEAWPDRHAAPAKPEDVRQARARSGDPWNLGPGKHVFNGVEPVGLGASPATGRPG
ncbi:LysR family transcriptional regulator [Streptomyces sp. NPDC101455]|uniref:LysR family transcriptional regulator n=1 Tax=Streptomyces sp. NPDC101455 TaxID=3366142 RepID=UPI00381DBB19